MGFSAELPEAHAQELQGAQQRDAQSGAAGCRSAVDLEQRGKPQSQGQQAEGGQDQDRDGGRPMVAPSSDAGVGKPDGHGQEVENARPPAQRGGDRADARQTGPSDGQLGAVE